MTPGIGNYWQSHSQKDGNDIAVCLIFFICGFGTVQIWNYIWFNVQVRCTKYLKPTAQQTIFAIFHMYSLVSRSANDRT